MKAIIRKRLAARKRRLQRRLKRNNYPADLSRPMIRGSAPRFELAGRAVGTAYGGIGLMQQLARELGLAEAIDQRLCIFKLRLPYFESDHVLNLAYNALCGAACLEDLELRRQDEAYLNLLGAARIPDPTTAGDFCRRFEPHHLVALQQAFDETRKKVWARQGAEFFAEARIEADGTMVQTRAECKEGIDINYKGQWGYHPLVLTLANTGEVLRLINRPGNRPSHEGAPALFDECIALCREAGFRGILLRGDTDFSQTEHLDRWHEQGNVRFVFGLDVTPSGHVRADDLPDSAWKSLHRPPQRPPRTSKRARPDRVKRRIVEERGFRNIQQIDEEVAEMEYRPAACRRAYRLVIVRKNLKVSEPKQGRLFDDYRYFFYITNDWESSPAQIVLSANDRCHQENIVAQLAAVRALHAPVDNLLSNEAYMLMTSLAWNLKAWLALWLPPERGDMPADRDAKAGGRDAKPRSATSRLGWKERLLGLEFRTFVNHFVRLPAQVVKTGRRIIVRLLGYNPLLPVYFRLADPSTRPQRC